MSKDYKDGFEDAVKKMHKLFVSERKALKGELKDLVSDTDYLSAYENKIKIEDLEFYIHALEQIKNGKDEFDYKLECKCLVCKGE